MPRGSLGAPSPLGAATQITIRRFLNNAFGPDQGRAVSEFRSWNPHLMLAVGYCTGLAGFRSQVVYNC
jgi:hypothetical protein